MPHRLDDRLFDNILLSVFKIIYEKKEISNLDLISKLSDLENKDIFIKINDLSNWGYISSKRDYSFGKKTIIYSPTEQGMLIWRNLCGCFSSVSKIDISSKTIKDTKYFGDFDKLIEDGLDCGLSLINADIENNAEVVLRGISTNLLENNAIVYVTTLSTPKEIRKELGRDIVEAEEEGKFVFVDLIPKIYDSGYSEYSVSSPDDAGRVMSVILSAYNSLKSSFENVLIVIDSLDDVVQEFSEVVSNRFIKKIISMAKENNSIILSLFKKGTLSEKVTNLILSAASIIFDFSHSFDGDTTRYYVRVKKARLIDKKEEYKLENGEFRLLSKKEEKSIEPKAKNYSEDELSCAYCRGRNLIISNINLDIDSATSDQLKFKIDSIYAYCMRCSAETLIFSKNKLWSDQFRDIPQFEKIYHNKIQEGFYKTRFCASCKKTLQSNSFLLNRCPHCGGSLNSINNILISQTGDNFGKDFIEETI